MLQNQTTRPIAPSREQSNPFTRLKPHVATIAGKKVVLVVANVEHDDQHDHFAELTRDCLPGVRLQPISWFGFLKALPTLDADIVFIASMRDAPDESGALRPGLEAFKRKNPKSVVAMANARMESGIPFLLQFLNLVDHVEHHDVFSISFLAEGVEMFAARQELQ